MVDLEELGYQRVNGRLTKLFGYSIILYIDGYLVNFYSYLDNTGSLSFDVYNYLQITEDTTKMAILSWEANTSVNVSYGVPDLLDSLLEFIFDPTKLTLEDKINKVYSYIDSNKLEKARTLLAYLEKTCHSPELLTLDTLISSKEIKSMV